MQQTVNAVTTNYTLDLNAGLAQVLADGTSNYLYGFGRIGEQAADWDYHLPDALGSVRQLADAAGVVSYAQSYEPYGEALGAFSSQKTAYGFAGEWTDGTGLQYLRARYYASGVGRFVSSDTWGGDTLNPMSYNYWLYAYANPINLTDPSGKTPQQPPNQRDLTDWLLREISSNANDPRVTNIRNLLRMYRSLGNNPILFGLAASKWISLVGDHKEWDFKHKIREELGNAVLLCDIRCRWYEYSTPGNIHYGFVGTAAGFTPTELHLGASYAEVTDPSHPIWLAYTFSGLFFTSDPDSLDCLFPLNFKSKVYVNPNWATTLFDDPTDYAAIDVGINTFLHGNFAMQLFSKSNNLMQMPEPSDSSTFSSSDWPYPLGHFDGGS